MVIKSFIFGHLYYPVLLYQYQNDDMFPAIMTNKYRKCQCFIYTLSSEAYKLHSQNHLFLKHIFIPSITYLFTKNKTDPKYLHHGEGKGWCNIFLSTYTIMNTSECQNISSFRMEPAASPELPFQKEFCQVNV